MKLSGWGKYPQLDATLLRPHTGGEAAALLRENGAVIARGLGRSYGDSALAEHVVAMAGLDHYLDFNAESGVLTAMAGVSLADILNVFVPKGWFLPVTPGTKFVTLGGAVASDVHGKNHHRDGCFSNHVLALQIATLSEGVVSCSRELRPELFHATCGGMGLTGIILAVTLQLRPINSAYIRETTYKARNLDEALALFASHDSATYSVAWIDCLARGDSLGRSLLMLGEHDQQGDLHTGSAGRLSVPVDMPGFMLNGVTIAAFNQLYYHRVRQQVSTRRVHYEPFFYPLDGVHHWNRLYGRRGFCQYQFVLPKVAGAAGVKAVLERIAAARRGSFLAVLKAFGESNANPLSFPMEGYTLALDFKIDRGLLPFLDELDRIVLDHGGRLYLAKDARMSAAVFKQSYPRWQEFVAVRQQYGADRCLHSLQSRRLGL